MEKLVTHICIYYIPTYICVYTKNFFPRGLYPTFYFFAMLRARFLSSNSVETAPQKRNIYSIEVLSQQQAT